MGQNGLSRLFSAVAPDAGQENDRAQTQREMSYDFYKYVC